MIQITSHAATKPGERYEVEGGGGQAWRHNYIGFSPMAPDKGQGWLLDSTPQRVLRAHYHAVDQFQVVINGSGLMGKHKVGPGSVHFSRANTPYGPIVWGDEGMGLLTIRVRPDTPGGPKYMPDRRDDLRKTPRNAYQVSQVVRPPRAMNGDVYVEAIPGMQDSNGLAAHAITLKAGASTLAPSPAGTGGQWILVMEGSLIYEGKTYPAFSIAEVSPDEKAFPLQAGPDGLHSMVLSFSREGKQGVDSEVISAKKPQAADRTWLCELCGFIYDEAAGMPEDSIPPGTRWEDVPDSWGCPDCSGTKADFKMVEL